MLVDLQHYPCPTQRLEAVRQRISSPILYMGLAGKTPTEVKIYPADYRALMDAVSRNVCDLEGFTWGTIRVVASPVCSLEHSA